MPDRLIAEPLPEIQSWMAERSGLIPVPDFRAVAREVDGKVVGAFGYDHHNRDWCFMHICLEPRGMNRRLLRMAFEVPFKQWGYEYVYAGIQETNKKCLKLAASLGFVEFDILPRVYPTERLRFLVMHKSDCRWLNLSSERV